MIKDIKSQIMHWHIRNNTLKKNLWLFEPLFKWILSFPMSKLLKYNDPGHCKALSNGFMKL